MDAKWDSYGARGILGNGKTQTIPIGATGDGRLFVAEGGSIAAVLKLDLSVMRTGQIVYDGEYSELAFAVVESPIKANVSEKGEEELYMSITDKTVIRAMGKKLRITNSAATGWAEIWIWR